METRRILRSSKIWILLTVCVLLNVCLFIRAQQNTCYGFTEMTTEHLSEAQEEYVFLMEQFIGKEYGKALEEVKELSELASRYEHLKQMLSVREILLSSEEGKQQWDMLFARDYDNYQNNYPDLLDRLENGIQEEEQEKIEIQSKAASKLYPQIKYLEGYESWLTRVQDNAERMKTFSIFDTDDGFSSTNIEQTARDFAGLHGIQVKLDNYQGVEAFFHFKITDYLLLIGVFLIVSCFSEGRKQGLWQMLYATPGGRSRVAVQRILALLSGSAVISAILYGSSFLAGVVIYSGLGELSNPVQSMELFGKLPLRITIWEMLVLYFILRVFTAFLIGLLFWLVLMAFHDRVKVSFAVIFLFLGMEYILYHRLTDRSAMNFFRYFNLFLYIDAGTFMQRYLNLNLFGMAVHIGKAALLFGSGLAVSAGSLCIWMEARRYPERKTGIMDRIVVRVARIGDLIHNTLSLRGWEYYKILIMQGGVLVLAVFFLLMGRMDYSVKEYPSMIDTYMEEFDGRITEETWKKVAELRDELTEGEQIYNDAVAAVQAEEINSFDYLARIDGHEHDQEKRMALDQFANILTEKEIRGQELGVDLPVVYEIPFQIVYGERTQMQRMQRALVILLALALLLAGIMTMEQTSTGLKQTIRSTDGGRMVLFLHKYQVMFGILLPLWLFSSLMEISTFLSMGTKTFFHEPVQSLTFLSEFPFVISISGYLALGYFLRLLMMLLTGGLVVSLSSMLRRMDVAYLATCGIFAAPAALWIYMGLDIFRWMTPASLIDLFGMLASQDGNMTLFVIAGMGYLLLSVTVSVTAIHRWCR